MGWIRYREEYKSYALGPNIQQEFKQDTIPVLSDATSECLMIQEKLDFGEFRMDSQDSVSSATGDS